MAQLLRGSPRKSLLVLLALLSGGCSVFTQTSALQSEQSKLAMATLQSRSASSVTGKISFIEQKSFLLVRYSVSGLKPNSEHGFHVHAIGDCSAADASSAGGHFNPGGRGHGHHGLHNRHLGDMANLRADSQGNARGEAIVADLTIAPGPNSIVGKSVVIHGGPDDYKSQPAGNSGARIACGMIVAGN